MPTDTDLEVTKTACYRADVARIKRIAERMEADGKATYFSQHIVSQALDALEEKLTKEAA